MPKKWKTIRIFISSTFRDIHAERDHLIRFVFPKLKEKCRKHRVHLIDVDLHWGVTEADAQDGKALDICLDEMTPAAHTFWGFWDIFMGPYRRVKHVPSLLRRSSMGFCTMTFLKQVVPPCVRMVVA